MKDTIKKLITGKGFYIVSALGIISAAIAVMLVYRTSTSMMNNIVQQQITTVPTQQAQMPKTDVRDPRVTESETQETELQEPETTHKETSEREESTVLEPISTTVNEAEVFSNDSFLLPVQGDVLKAYSPETPVFDETMNDWRVHRGTDFMGKIGEDVLSVGNGRVSKVVSDPSYGYIVEIDYGTFIARYCGLEQGTAVHPEDIVKKGDVVGKLGNIPCESEMEAHLHFEVLFDGAYADPVKTIGQ